MALLRFHEYCSHLPSLAHDPLQAETTFDKALISDVRALCTTLSSKSEDAQRLVEITVAFDRVAFELMKSVTNIKRGKVGRRKKNLVQKYEEDYLMKYLILAIPKRALMRNRPEDAMPDAENNTMIVEGSLTEYVEPNLGSAERYPI